MNVNIGKYHNLSVEELLLRDPDYINWLFQQTHPSYLLQEARQEAYRLMTIFDEKSFLHQCHHPACTNMATRASHARRNFRLNYIAPWWWCDECSPRDIGRDQNDFQMMRDYGDVMYFVEVYTPHSKRVGKRMIEAFAKAKGLPERYGRREVQAFFRHPVLALT